MPLKFILKKQKGSSDPDYVGSNIIVPTPTVIWGLHGVDIVVSSSTYGLYVISGGQIVVHISIDKIGNWDIYGNKLMVYSIDETPLDLSFVSPTDASNALITMQNAINNI